jgi:reticulon-4-interacting protein 1, mitochondrial
VHSPSYLASGKPFISVGVLFQRLTFSNIFSSSMLMLKNNLLPRWLGGTDRVYVLLSTVEDRKNLEELRRLVEEEGLKTAVDEVLEFEDVLQVSDAMKLGERWQITNIEKGYEKLLQHRASGKIVVKVREL